MPTKGQRFFNSYRIDGDVTYLELTNRSGEVIAETQVSTSDLPRLIAFGHRWGAAWFPDVKQYRVKAAIRTSSVSNRTLHLPRFLLNAPDGLEVDHINRNTLDNRRENLRLVTQLVNSQNKAKAPAGAWITWDSSRSRFKVRHRVGGKVKSLGSFVERGEAERVLERYLAQVEQERRA